MKVGFADRVHARLEELGLTPRSASLSVSTNPDLFRNVLRFGDAANPKQATLAAMARALGWTVEELVGLPGGAKASEYHLADVTLPPPEAMPRDVPVRGTALGSVIDHTFVGFAFFGADPIDYVRRPPALANVPDAYAIYVSGDSMEHLHPEGELRFVNPHRPARPGDSVVVQTRHWEHDPGQGYIKILRRRGGEYLTLEQLNPPATIQIPTKYVVSVHRVLTLNELFGV